jgi:hypothetical protein
VTIRVELPVSCPIPGAALRHCPFQSVELTCGTECIVGPLDSSVVLREIVVVCFSVVALLSF